MHMIDEQPNQELYFVASSYPDNEVEFARDATWLGTFLDTARDLYGSEFVTVHIAGEKNNEINIYFDSEPNLTHTVGNEVVFSNTYEDASGANLAEEATYLLVMGA